MNNQDIVRIFMLLLEAIALYAIQGAHRQASANGRGISTMHACLDGTKAEIREIKESLKKLTVNH